MQSQTVSCPPCTVSDSTFNALVEAFRRERERADPGLVDWQYIHTSRSIEQQRELHQWRGTPSLLEWIEAMGANHPVEDGGLRVSEQLIDASNTCHERLFESLGGRFDAASLDVYNALDFSICSVVPHMRSVLDYGAGYGRQAFLFSRIPGARIFANDAVEASYFCQYWVFRTLGLPLWEYFDHQTSLQEFLAGEGARVIHLPTWHNDLIPDHSLDLVLFVWCLSEMPDVAAEHALDMCTRKLREGGYVYLRDEPHTHGWRTEKKLIVRGFLPVFQPWRLTRDVKMDGTPRLYRYLPNYLNKRNTIFCQLMFTAWRSRALSLPQLLVRLRRMLPF